MANLLNAIAGINPLAGTVAKTITDEKQNFGDTLLPDDGFSLSRIIGILMTIFAFYLLSKCRKNQDFNMVLNVLAAFCCAPFYIIYRLFIAPC